MSKRIVLLFSLALSGCGITNPRLPEFWAAPDATARKVDNITAQTACELGKTIYNLSQYKVNEWLADWGAQISLSISAVERSELNPGVSLVNPLRTATTTFAGGSTVASPQSFNLGIGADASSENTNKGTLSVFYTVPELIEIGRRSGPTCQPSVPTPGYLFYDSDLGIAEWINASVGVGTSGVARFPKKKAGPYGQNTISESIKFDITTSGTVSPQWKLVRVTADTSGNLFMARRERVQQIDITFGPMQNGVLSPNAYAQLNAQLIAAALQQRVQN